MNHFFIIEQTEIVYPDEIKIISESVLESGRTSVSALTRLQRDNVINSNRRVYETTVCESIVGQLAPRAKANSLLQEMSVSSDEISYLS